MAVRRWLLVGVVVVAGAAGAPAALGAAPVPVVVTGQDAGWPEVAAWTAGGGRAQGTAPWGSFTIRFAAYSGLRDGVRVAVADVNGDGKADIVTAPAGGWWTEIRAFDGRTYRQLAAYPPFKDGGGWGSGAYVAVGDAIGDGRPETIVGLDQGCCTSIRVLDAATGNDLNGFFTYGSSSQVGVRVAAADVNGDGKAEIAATPVANGGTVDLFAATGGAPFRSIALFPAGTPTAIAAGDVLGAGRVQIVAAGNGPAGPQVKIVDPQSGDVRMSLFPFGPGASSPQVAVADVDGDGNPDVIASAQSTAGTQVKAYDARSGLPLASFFVLEPGIVPGASLAGGDLDGDGKAEIVLGGGPTPTPWPPVANGPDQRVAVFHADGTLVGSFSAYPGVFQGGVRVALADLDRDRKPELVTAPGPRMEPEVDVYAQDWVSSRDRGTRLGHFLAYEPAFRGGVSVAACDVLGRGVGQIVTGPGPGRPADVRVFDAAGSLLTSFRAFEDSYTGGISVGCGDLDRDGRAEVVVGTSAGAARVRAFHGDGAPYGGTVVPWAATDRGVQVAVADLAGTGRGVVLAATASGSDPLLALVDAQSSSVTRVLEPLPASTAGLRVAAGDIDNDGRDEIVLAPGWGGDGVVRVLDRAFAPITSWLPVDNGFGFNVAVASRIGLPIRPEARTVKVRARRLTDVVVARFVDASPVRVSPITATVTWPDGTTLPARVSIRGVGLFDVRVKRIYKIAGRYFVDVTLRDGSGRTSTAHSTIIVRRR